VTYVSRPPALRDPPPVAPIGSEPIATPAPVLATLPADPLPPASAGTPRAESIPPDAASLAPTPDRPDDPATTGALGPVALPPVEPLPSAEETAALVRRMFNAPSAPATAPESVPSPEPRPKNFDVDSSPVSASR
jgi:hypothetical protein